MNAYLQAFFCADCLGTVIVSLLTQFDTHSPCMSICVQQLAKRPPGSDCQLFNVTPCWCEGSATPSKAAEAQAGEGVSHAEIASAAYRE